MMKWRTMCGGMRVSSSIALFGLCSLGTIGCEHPDRVVLPLTANTPAAKGVLGRMEADSSPPPLLASTGNELKDVPVEKRIVVYNAGFRIVVQSIADAIKSMEQIATQTGGYVQQIDRDKITIRVPVQQYSGAVERVAALGQVTDRQLQTQDVTAEYVDLEARLKNARAVHERLTALLEKAQTTEATLAVEKELGRVGEEIERLQAQLELLKNRVAYSTIAAQFERVARQAELIMNYRRLPFAWLRELDPNLLFVGY